MALEIELPPLRAVWEQLPSEDGILEFSHLAGSSNLPALTSK